MSSQNLICNFEAFSLSQKNQPSIYNNFNLDRRKIIILINIHLREIKNYLAKYTLKLA